MNDRQVLQEHRTRHRDLIEGRITVEEYVQSVKDEIDEDMARRYPLTVPRRKRRSWFRIFKRRAAR